MVQRDGQVAVHCWYRNFKLLIRGNIRWKNMIIWPLSLLGSVCHDRKAHHRESLRWDCCLVEASQNAGLTWLKKNLPSTSRLPTLAETAAATPIASQPHAKRIELNEQRNKLAEGVNSWLLALMKSTDAASALDVRPRDGWTHMQGSRMSELAHTNPDNMLYKVI